MIAIGAALSLAPYPGSGRVGGLNGFACWVALPALLVIATAVSVVTIAGLLAWIRQLVLQAKRYNATPRCSEPRRSRNEPSAWR
jgi:hypothetical protein